MNKKRNKPQIIGVSVLVVILAILIVPFLVVHGKHDFSAFWGYFFDKIFNLPAFGAAFIPIIKTIPVTLELTVLSGVFGLALGLVLALVKINKVPIFDKLRALFVSFTRGTPLLVQLYLWAFGIPLVLRAINYNYGTNFNINAISPILIGTIAYALNEAAYGSETIRAAIESVDSGQIEAGKALGMTSSQIFRRITLPEAARVAVAPLGNALLGLLKNTSFVFVIGVVEMTATAQILSGSNFRQMETYLALAIIYWPMCIIIEQLIRLIERSLDVKMPNDTRKNRAAISLTKNPFDVETVSTVKIDGETKLLDERGDNRGQGGI